jgi:hypothetical protein
VNSSGPRPGLSRTYAHGNKTAPGLQTKKDYDRGASVELVDHAMRVRALFFAAAVFLCASITVAIAQEASIYGVFCETPEQAEMYILEQQQGNSPQDTFEEVLKQDKKYNCMKLHVTAVGILLYHSCGGRCFSIARSPPGGEGAQATLAQHRPVRVAVSIPSFFEPRE